MADEYIRLDTTIMGIDGLINEAPTGSQARALFCAKDMIYDQQRYVSEMKPVKRGKWLHDRRTQWKCSKCGNFLDFDGLNCGRGTAFYCPNCGARMDGEQND